MKKKIIDYEKIIKIARNKTELEELLIGKYYVLYNFDGLIIIKFKINYVKTEKRETFIRVSVSDKGYNWYGLYNDNSTNIVDK